MKKRILTFVLFFALILSSNAYAHGAEPDFGDNPYPYPLTQMQAVGYGSLAFAILTVIIFFFSSKMSEMTKKLVFSLLVLIVAFVTIYLAITTVHTNISSATKGPVHWHADYEIWVCGKRLSLPEPHGMSNKQGTPLLHSHNDNRIHIEGALMQERQASLGAFFQATGGYLSDDEIKFPTDEGLVEVHNGDLCNGQSAKLYVFVNGISINDSARHVVAPYGKVPPGDKVKFVFTEKSIENTNPDLG